MKKFFFMVILAVAATGASAQCYLGGTFQFGYADADGTSTTTFGVLPEFGYNITDVFAVGTEVVFNVSKTGEADAVYVWGVAPYVRANFARIGTHVKLFADAYLAYEWANQSDVSIDGFEVGLRPGINVALNERWSLIGKMTLLSYSRFDDVNTTTFKLGPTSVQLGVAYNF